ncbi:hypothetical protein P3T40_003944 [Paraburkholderia sp. EB58]
MKCIRTGKIENRTGKVFLNHTRSRKKEKAPKGALFNSAALPLYAGRALQAGAWLRSVARRGLQARLRYSFVRVSISILSPMLQKSGTCSS